MAPKMAPKKSTSKSARSHRSTLSLQKTEIMINVYDLLPPGRFASLLWTVGSSLLHSGVVINGKEYAYGGHDKRGVTGVYWTKPGTLPPGGTFKQEILHGFTLSSQAEIDAIIHEVSNEFQGTAYNILTQNCNHFTAHLCQRLTGRSGPGWLNRAASIGVALPCIVPRDWIEPPEYDTQGGDLLDDESDSDERSRMLRASHDAPRLVDVRSSDDNPSRKSSDRSSGGSSRGEQRR